MEWSLIFLKALIYGLYLKVMSLLVLITGKAGASNLCENTSQEVMVLALVQRCTAKTAYLSGKINTIQLPDFRFDPTQDSGAFKGHRLVKGRELPTTYLIRS